MSRGSKHKIGSIAPPMTTITGPKLISLLHKTGPLSFSLPHRSRPLRSVLLSDCKQQRKKQPKRKNSCCVLPSCFLPCVKRIQGKNGLGPAACSPLAGKCVLPGGPSGMSWVISICLQSEILPFFPSMLQPGLLETKPHKDTTQDTAKQPRPP